MKTLVAGLVSLIINTPFNTPSHDSLYITGDIKDCHWKPKCLKLNKVSENKYQIKLPLEEGVEFKITRGSWEKEAADSRGRPLKNLVTANTDNRSKLIVDIKNWKDLGALRATGNIVRVTNFYSPELNNSRSLHIRLPDNYLKTKKRYPVIYMHDGQNAFDPNTSSFGTDWSVDEVLSKLASSGKTRDAIVVGIFHKERHREYNDEDLGQLYGEFIVETLKPYIDRNFRTRKEREHTFLMGSSYGSAISVSLAFRYPQVFGKSAGLSFNASFFNDMLFRLSDELPMTTTHLYLDHGSRGGDQKFGAHFKRYLKHLSRKGIPKDLITYRVYPDTNHTESDWARRVHIPLQFLLGPPN